MAASDIVARRYAAAYFAVGREKGRIPEFREQLERAVATVEMAEVARALGNPALDRRRRTELALSLLEGASPEVRNLVRLLLDRGRLSIIGAVLEQYDRLADRESGIVRAEVATAVPVDDPLRARIASTLAQHFGGEVRTTVRHDPSILGGLVIRVGDRVIDGSVRTRLQQLQAALA